MLILESDIRHNDLVSLLNNFEDSGCLRDLRYIFIYLSDGLLSKSHPSRQKILWLQREYQAIAFKVYPPEERFNPWFSQQFNPDGSWKNQRVEKARQAYLNADIEHDELTRKAIVKNLQLLSGQEKTFLLHLLMGE